MVDQVSSVSHVSVLPTAPYPIMHCPWEATPFLSFKRLTLIFFLLGLIPNRITPYHLSGSLLIPLKNSAVLKLKNFSKDKSLAGEYGELGRIDQPNTNIFSSVILAECGLGLSWRRTMFFPIDK